MQSRHCHLGESSSILHPPVANSPFFICSIASGSSINPYTMGITFLDLHSGHCLFSDFFDCFEYFRIDFESKSNQKKIRSGMASSTPRAYYIFKRFQFDLQEQNILKIIKIQRSGHPSFPLLSSHTASASPGVRREKSIAASSRDH